MRRSASPVRCGVLVRGSRLSGCYALTDANIWFAIAQLTGFINLFNLIPVWRALQRETGPGDARVLATFVMLVFALSLLARGVN